jgi:hypothetical protein
MLYRRKEKYGKKLRKREGYGKTRGLAVIGQIYNSFIVSNFFYG